MLTLGPCFNSFQPTLNRKLNRLVITDLKVKKRMVFNTAPVSTKQTFSTNKVNRTSDITMVSSTHDEQYIIRHGFADDREELTGQIRGTPLTATRVDVETIESIPVIFSDIGPGQTFNPNICSNSIAPFTADILAFF